MIRQAFAGVAEITNDPTDELRTGDLTNNPFIQGDAYSGIADSNGIITLNLGRTAVGVSVISSPFLCFASIAQNKNGIVKIRLTRAWEFLEYIEDPGGDFDFKTELRGDYDYEYKLVSHWERPSASAANLVLRINGSATVASAASAIEGGASATTTDLVVGTAITAGPESHAIKTRIEAKSGSNRRIHSIDASDVDIFTISAAWSATTTRLTSLGLSGRIDTGSKFTLYRKPQFDKTKLTLWVY